MFNLKEKLYIVKHAYYLNSSINIYVTTVKRKIVSNFVYAYRRNNAHIHINTPTHTYVQAYFCCF